LNILGLFELKYGNNMHLKGAGKVFLHRFNAVFRPSFEQSAGQGPPF